MSASVIEALADLDPDDQDALLSELTDEELDAALRDWRTWAREEQLDPDGEHTIWAKVAGRGEGKALDDATLIPTPAGWAKMGDLRPGSVVFDEHGQPCTVVAVYPQGAVPGWRLRFSDGTAIVACADHQWVTTDALWRKRRNRQGQTFDGWEREPPRTTAEVVATLTRGKRGDRNHAIPLTSPLDLPVAALPLDPYVLGVWLGDGSSRSAEITTHDDDAPHYAARFAAAGWPMRLARRRHADRPVGTWTFGQLPLPTDPETGRFASAGGVHATLRSMGVLNAKHVPSAYLRASAEQRLALVQGLMDTDGYVDERGHAEFCSTRRVLADAMLELLRSLGERPRLAEGRAMLYGRDCGPKFRVTLRPAIQLVSLPRKVARLSPLGAQSSRHGQRMIVAAEPVDPRPMTCITVDAPSSMFLAGEAMIPTHNTRTGSEWSLDRSETMAEHGRGEIHRVTFVGRTAGDIRDVQIEGESGLVACAERRGHVCDYEPSKRRVTLPDLGTIITLRSAEEPESLRGVQHHSAWADEPGAWTHKVDAQGGTAWSNLLLGLRLDPPVATGLMPRVCATTTPRPIPLIVDWFVAAGLIPDPETGDLRQPDPTLAITRGTMLDNLGNLSPAFVQQIVGAYGGTTLGAQEIMGELVSAVEGALWRPEDIRRAPRAPSLGQVVVAVDPPGSTTGAECGIVVAGSAHRVSEAGGKVRHGYVLDDLSVRGRAEQWASAAVAAFRHYKAHAIVAEVNFGGDMVRATIHGQDPTIPVKLVRAGRGMSKTQRAVPVAMLYQQGRVHHVGQFGLLEAQMLTWVEGPGSISPDRMDALVWALRYLLPSLSMAPARSVSTAGQRMQHGAKAATTKGSSRSPAAAPIRLARNTGRRT